MRRELLITRDPIDEGGLLRARRVPGHAGAVVYFVGLVRDHEGDTAIESLEYEAFERMVEHQFNLLFDQMQQNWPIESVRLVHRIGVVPVGEPSLWVEIVAPHRAEALAACEWLIDALKRVVPIWKKPGPGQPGSGTTGSSP